MLKPFLLVMASLLTGLVYSQPSLKNLQKQLASKTAKGQTFDLNLLSDSRGILKTKGGSNTTESTLGLLKAGLGLRKTDDAFNAGETTKLAGGVVVQKFEQFYKGIKVEHGGLSFTSKASSVKSVMLEFYSVPNELSVIPQLNEAAAFDKAVLYVAATKYPWDNQNGKVSSFKRPEGTLTILEDFYGKKQQVRLAYKFLISADKPFSRSWVYVDAVDGRLLLIDRIIKHIEGAGDKNEIKNDKIHKPEADRVDVLINDLGTSDTRYSGNRPFTTDFNGTTYNLRESRNSHNITTLNYNRKVTSAANSALATDFVDNDNNWTTIEHAFHYDDGAHDVQFAMEFISDYWETVHGRHSWNNAYGEMRSYVHVREIDTLGYDNAFWSGDAMFYGDGTYYDTSGNGAVLKPLGFKPLSALDVSAHELGHAVCQSTAGLVYQRESGALNEGFSDIWAACVENYSGLPKSPWLIGEEIYPARGALRSLQNPNLFDNPDTYGGINWKGTTLATCPIPNQYEPRNDLCGVHNNSGVLNKWFYLITQGETGVNDIGNAYQVVGLGFSISEQIAYLTELTLTSNADFAQTRAASIAAAELIYGICSNEVVQVANAWFAVGVGNTSECVPTVEFSKTATITLEGNGAAGNCSAVKLINVPVKLNAPSSQPTDINVSLSGTATQGNDYTLASSTITFNATESGVKNLSFSVQDDGSVEPNETIIINYIVNNNGGEGIAGVNNQTHTITLTNDDEMPALITAAPTTYPILYNENFDSRARGSVFPPGWGTAASHYYHYLYGPFAFTSQTQHYWAIGANGGAGITGNAAYISTSAGAANPPYAYNANGNAVQTLTNKLVRLPAMNTIGKKNLKFSFRYKVGGEFDAGTYGVYDYGQLLYDANGIGTVEALIPMTDPSTTEPFIFYGDGATVQNVNALSLPFNMANNAVTYLGFKWTNDEFGGVARPLLIDEILVTGTTTNTGIETQPTQSSSLNIRSGMDNYLMSAADSQLIARVRNPSENLACVTGEIFQSGSGQIPLLTYTGSFQRTEKLIKLSPAIANSTATWEGTLYFTTAELAAWGANDVNLKILKVKDGQSFAGHINNDNAEIITPTSVTKDAVNGVIAYTATFTGFSQFALVTQNITLPVNFLKFEVQPIGRTIRLEWATAQEKNNKGFLVERSTDGISFENIGFVRGRGTNDLRSEYTFTDIYVQPGTIYYYRLRQQDYDGHESFSVIKKASFEANGLLLSLSPNPATDKVRLFVSGNKKPVDLQLLNSQGQVVRTWKQVNAFSSATYLNINGLSGGMYMLRLNWPDETRVEKLMIR